ncbi:hypothetical protein IAD21_00337 [Abditibacteriota bacterium]|nr:hypothetical protein IAD21_00337 [Abditibacteriota bacterium]
MPRPRSQKVELVTQKLRTRLQAGVHRPGERFLSTRELESTFGISYQTAHRVLGELCGEGLLERRAGSGTFIPGGIVDLQGVQLIMNPRANIPKSFGARLLEDLTQRLDNDRISWKLSWTDGTERVSRTRLPILWEAREALRECGASNRCALLLNDRPRPGLESALIDSVSIDDFSGGASAAGLLKNVAPRQSRFVVVTGPEEDSRSQDRRDGFLSVCEDARVVVAGSWFLEDGTKVAPTVVREGVDGIFCCNDRLAEAVWRWCETHECPLPPLIGFDNAPIAESLDLTTIAIPWDDMITGALDVVKKRLSGGGGAARQLILTPLPIIRRL